MMSCCAGVARALAGSAATASVGRVVRIDDHAATPIETTPAPATSHSARRHGRVRGPTADGAAR